MTFAAARFRLPEGPEVAVLPGGILGRLSTASLRLADPRVSEAHAMVSLRGQELRLLSLRGWLWVDGQHVLEVVLTEGLVVGLCPDLLLTVTEVNLPSTLLALRCPDDSVHPLHAHLGEAASLIGGPPWALVAGHRLEARARLTVADGWFVSVDAGPPVELLPGGRLCLAGLELGIEEVPFVGGGATQTATQGAPRCGCAVGLNATTFSQGERRVLTLRGRPHQLLAELAAYGPGEQVGWRFVSELIWTDIKEEQGLLNNFHKTLRVLRKKLCESGLPLDLVQSQRGDYWLNRQGWRVE